MRPLKPQWGNIFKLYPEKSHVLEHISLHAFVFLNRWLLQLCHILNLWPFLMPWPSNHYHPTLLWSSRKSWLFTQFTYSNPSILFYAFLPKYFLYYSLLLPTKCWGSGQITIRAQPSTTVRSVSELLESPKAKINQDDTFSNDTEPSNFGKAQKTSKWSYCTLSYPILPSGPNLECQDSRFNHGLTKIGLLLEILF